jgi:DNA-directed RNA polymerase subunit RPC12/RpoP
MAQEETRANGSQSEKGGKGVNDYWNDPPEQDEGPQCPYCGIPLNPFGALFQCSECGHIMIVKAQPEIAPEPEPAEPITWDDRMIPMGGKCPHGNEWFSCDACDHASDIAYDSNRERGQK